MYFALVCFFGTCILLCFLLFGHVLKTFFLKIKCLFYKIEPLDFHWILNCVRLVLGFAWVFLVDAALKCVDIRLTIVARIALFLYWRGISAKKTFNHADFVSWKIFQPIRDLIYMIVRLHVVSLRKWASWWSSWWRRGQWQWAQVNPQEWFSNIVASHTFDWLDLVLLLHMFLTFHGCSGLRSCVDHYLICGSFHIHTCRTWIPWLGWMPLWANHRG